MASPANANPVFDLEMKACAEALQSAQKRTRIAFFLSISVSFIILLMVFNLWEARRFRNMDLKSTPSDKLEYLKEYSRHMVDESYYQIPSLGIQITCDDVGLLGPLTLLIFSFYSMMAFTACNEHVQCARKFTKPLPEKNLINTLLETEKLPKPAQLFSILQWVLLFLPSITCGAVSLYAVFAHFRPPLSTDPLIEIIMKNQPIAKWLDVAGAIFTFSVLFCNYRAFSFSKTVWPPTTSKTSDSAKAEAAGA